MTAVVVLAGCGLFAPAAASAAGLGRAAGEVAEAARWYPLAAGRAWTYQAGESQFTVRVAGSDADGTRLETVLNDRVIATEVMQARPDGVYRTRLTGQAVTPPVGVLALDGGAPAAAGTEWAVDSQVAGQGVSGRFTLGREKVTVPAGEFEAVVVRGPTFDVAGTPTGLTYWFARDVGMVKLVYTIGGNAVELVLASFDK